VDKPIAKNALTILINISGDAEVLKELAEDDGFLETILARVTVCGFPLGKRPYIDTYSSLSYPGSTPYNAANIPPPPEPQRANRKCPLHAPSQPRQIPLPRTPHPPFPQSTGPRPLPLKTSHIPIDRMLQPRRRWRLEQRHRLRLPSLSIR